MHFTFVRKFLILGDNDHILGIYKTVKPIKPVKPEQPGFPWGTQVTDVDFGKMTMYKVIIGCTWGTLVSYVDFG